MCGGVDRFYVRADGSFYCRQCLPDGKNPGRVVAMMDSLGLDTESRPKGPPEWVSDGYAREAAAEQQEPDAMTVEIAAASAEDRGPPLSDDEALLIGSLRAIEAVEAGDRGESLTALREMLPEVEDVHEDLLPQEQDGEARFLLALKKNPRTITGELLARAKLAIDDPMRPVQLSTFKDAPLAERIIWQENKYGAVLSEGEVTILSGAGGVGKSYLSLAFGVAASSFQDNVCGFGIRPGKVVLLSYEDRGPKVAWRAGLIAGRGTKLQTPVELPGGFMTVPNPPPLWEATDFRQTGPTKEWAPLWDMIREQKPTFVIIDPFSSATPGLESNDAAGSRAFMAALAEECDGFGILLVAHSTKVARVTPWRPGLVSSRGRGRSSTLHAGCCSRSPMVIRSWWCAPRQTTGRITGALSWSETCVVRRYSPGGFATSASLDRKSKRNSEEREIMTRELLTPESAKKIAWKLKFRYTSQLLEMVVKNEGWGRSLVFYELARRAEDLVYGINGPSDIRKLMKLYPYKIDEI